MVLALPQVDAIHARHEAALASLASDAQATEASDRAALRLKHDDDCERLRDRAAAKQV
jgi:hypothetical protein